MPSGRAVGGRWWLHSIRDDKKDRADLLQDLQVQSLKPHKLYSRYRQSVLGGKVGLPL